MRALPADVLRTTVERQSLRASQLNVLGYPLEDVRSIITITGVGESVAAPDVDSVSTDSPIIQAWNELKAQCSDLWGWVPDVIEIEGSEEELFSSFYKGEFCIISDGSYQDGVGSFATQVTTVDCRHHIWLLGQTPGSQPDQSAYHSEQAGILAVVQLVSLTRKALGAGYLSSVSPTVKTACDGKAALDTSFNNWTLKPTAKQFDIASALRSLIRDTKVNWVPLHVKGLPQQCLDSSC